MRNILFPCFVAIIAQLCISSPANTDENLRVWLGREVEPFTGAVQFCKAMPSRCEPSEETRVAMTASRMAELVFVNLTVNVSVAFVEEDKEADVWQDRDFTEGDCEDIALLKRRELIALGWPPGALKLAIVIREEGDREGHAVLVASTDAGDFVLDVPGEKSGQLRAWNPKEFYQLRMVWGADMKWYAFAPRPGFSVTAAAE